MDTVKKYLWQIILIILIFCMLFISMKFFEDANIIAYFTNLEHIAITFLIWTSLYFIFKGLTDKTVLSLSFVVFIQIVFDIINYIVRISRGSGITLSDFSTLKTAYSVVGNIKIVFNTGFYARYFICIYSYSYIDIV